MFIPSQRPAKTTLRGFDRSVFHVKHRTGWRVRMIRSVCFPSGPRLAGRRPSHPAPSPNFRTPQSVDHHRAPLPAGESLQWAIAARRLDCGPHLWVTQAGASRRSPFPSGHWYPEQRRSWSADAPSLSSPAPHASEYSGFAHSLHDDLRPLCASRRRSLGEAANWDTRPPSGEWGPSFTSSPTRTKQVRTECAHSLLMQQTRAASASSAVTGQAALPVGPRSTLKQHLKSGPLQHGDDQRASRRDPCRRRAREGKAPCATRTGAMRQIYRPATCAMFHVKHRLSFNTLDFDVIPVDVHLTPRQAAKKSSDPTGPSTGHPRCSWGLKTHLSVSER